MSGRTEGLRVLVVEDESATREELATLLDAAGEVRAVRAAESGEAAVRLLGTDAFDAVFLDVSMPGLSGVEVGRVLGMLSEPPAIVFVTASEAHRDAARDMGAVDYLLKPVRDERLAEAVARVRAARRPEPVADELVVVRIDTGRHIFFVRRDDVYFVEAHGDYVRLHTGAGVHLIRQALSHLETVWGPAGFVRVHRGYLVAIRWVRDLRAGSSSGLLAHTPAGDVPVSRRHARALKERLLAAVREQG
ncbi:LytTR family DNA-binding domain-containing protein [Streptomyces carpaticus]|uniref:LytR/AlgR family response regulator transcription factor n=1 Tax=Streptomyces carpaticus TaxID=285558 RepID=UPI0022053C1C|nr:LytTR family DNA-binding domain-containing protein [Streptomyces carpaticus]